MATQRWVAGSGVGFTWTAAFGAEVNSIVSGNAILSSIAITNQTALDMYADISFSLGAITTLTVPYIGFYLMPLNEDGTSYGDGRFGSSAAGPPGSTYFIGNIVLPVVTTTVLTGSLIGISLPPGTFKFCLYNVAGNSLAGSANVVDYRTYNFSIT